LYLARVFPMLCAMHSMIKGVPHITSQTEWEKVFNFRDLLFLLQTWHTTHHKCEKETTNNILTFERGDYQYAGNSWCYGEVNFFPVESSPADPRILDFLKLLLNC
jgi:hypothetical protein